MRITIVQDSIGRPVVSVQGDTGDTAEDVVRAYREAQKIQPEGEKHK